MAARKSVIKMHEIVHFFKDEMSLIKKGEDAMEAKHVSSISYDNVSGVIAGYVAASMKDKTYTVKIQMSDEMKISKAECSCPRGQGLCHHMAALLIYGHHNMSVTDVRCGWLQTGPKDTPKTRTVSSLFPHAGSSPHLSEEEKMSTISEVNNELARCEEVVGFSWLLKDEPPVEESGIIGIKMEQLIFSEEYDSSDDKFKFLENSCSLPVDLIPVIAEETIGQAANWKWAAYRSYRLTASNFGFILAAMNRNRFPPSLFKRLLGLYNLEGVKSVQWGSQKEHTVLQVMEQHLNTKICKTGLWLHPCGYLGASPDGIATDSSGVSYLVEVKCPYKYRNCMLSEELKTDKTYFIHFDEDNTVKVNHNHEYYHQVQGELYFTNLDSCIVGVWTPKECVLVEILRDAEWEPNIEKVKHFYVNSFVPWVLENPM